MINRNPFNWAGNKYKYINTINDTMLDNKYNSVYDVFMGSGNILTNLNCSADVFVGNDIIPLLPKLYEYITNETEIYKIAEIEKINDDWNKFSDKKDYYDFRDHWNKKYLSGQYDKNFVYETIMLLKMCSNSMVRFNRGKGYFNQGFRGVARNKTEFFSQTSLDKIVADLNKFKDKLQNKTFTFANKDFKLLLEEVNQADLVILDPPYILSDGMYGTDFTKEDDDYILDFLSGSKVDFVLFNYLSSGDQFNVELDKFIRNNDVKVKVLNEMNAVGQGRSANKKVEEVMVYRFTGKQRL